MSPELEHWDSNRTGSAGDGSLVAMSFFSRFRRIVLAMLVCACGVISTGDPLSAQPYLWQTNSEGDDIHVIDLATRKAVDRIVVGPEPHGIAASADESVVLVSLEANDREQGQVDTRTKTVVHSFQVGKGPKRNLVLGG